jgi:hypothetical protein
MTETNWRDEWPEFRVHLIDETARCLADQQSAATGGQRPRWEALTTVQQTNLAENIAGVYLAQDQALANLIKRGLVP